MVCVWHGGQCIFGSADIFTTMENCKYKLASLALFLSPSLVTAPQMICHKFILYSHVHVLAHIHHMYHIYIYIVYLQGLYMTIVYHCM